MNASTDMQSATRPAGVTLPSSLSDLRERYAALCSALPLPDIRTESWHYGRPDRFLPEGLETATSVDITQRGSNAAKLAESHGHIALRLAHNELITLNGDTADSQAGFKLVSSDTDRAGFDDVNSWLEYLNERDSDRLEAEQYSRLGQVLHISVPANTQCETPVHLIVDMPAGGQARYEQIVVDAGRDSSISLHLHITGDDVEGQSLLHLGIHLDLADNAAVDLVRYQNTGKGCDIRGIETQCIAAHARLRSTSLFVGGRNMRHDVCAHMQGSGSEAILRGLYLMGGRQSASIFSHQDHQVANAHSDLLFKGTMLDRAAASYLGQISVAPDAQGTDAYQSNRSLLLSPKARSSSSPQLEIEANDVRCSHGASVANVSAEELFYLESRGIDPETGRQLLVSGFLAEIADLVPQGALREYVYENMLERRV